MINIRATPEQWADTEYWAHQYGNAQACILELRSRVEALEADQWLRHHAKPKQSDATLNTRLHSYKVGEAEPIEDWGKGHTLAQPAPAGSLVERVARAVENNRAPYGSMSDIRVAIREVALWMDEKACDPDDTRLLREEADR